MKRLSLLLVILSLIVVSDIQAQKNDIKGNYRRMSLDVYGGIPFFHGDTKNKFVGYSATGRFNIALSSAFSLGAEFTYGQVKGEDTDGSQAYFTNQYMKAMGGAELYFFNAFRFNELTNWFQPYLGLNAGMIKGKVKEAGLNGVDFTEDELYNEWAFASGFHLGAKFKVTKFMDINFRYGFTNVGNDNFDMNNEDFIANQYYDHFSEAQLGATFHFWGKDREPLIWKPASEKQNKERDAKIDSLQNELGDIEEQLADAEEEVDDLNADNGEMQERVGALEEMVSQLAENSGLGISDTFWGADEHIYVATLEGPINATYFIVAGSYAIDANAAARVKELKELGHTPIIMDEVHADLNRVTVAHTNDYDEALIQVMKYRKELDPSAWILKKRKL